MNTGDNTRILGLYATDCCEYELIMDMGEEFPTMSELPALV